MKDFKSYVNEVFETTQILSILYDSEFQFDELMGIEPLIVEMSEKSTRRDQPWENVSGYTDDDKLSSAKKIHGEAMKLALQYRNELTSKLKKSTKKIRDPKILVDIKSEKSFIDKISSRGKSAKHITDVLRSAVIVKKVDVENVVKQIKKQFNVVEYELKTKSMDQEFGYYGSHHFLVQIGELTVEIQVMSRRMWAYKNEAHKIYTKFRSSGDFSKEFEKVSKRMSKDIFNKANQ